MGRPGEMRGTEELIEPEDLKKFAGVKKFTGVLVYCLFDPVAYYLRGAYIHLGEFQESLQEGVLPPGSCWKIGDQDPPVIVEVIDERMTTSEWIRFDGPMDTLERQTVRFVSAGYVLEQTVRRAL